MKVRVITNQEGLFVAVFGSYGEAIIEAELLEESGEHAIDSLYVDEYTI